MPLGAEGPHRGEGSGGRRDPQRGTGGKPRWGSRGLSPRKQNEFDVLTLPKIAFPHRNSNKLHFLKRTVLLMTIHLFFCK